MPVTGWLEPRWGTFFEKNVTFNGMTDAGWLERELKKHHALAALGYPTRSRLYVVSVGQRTGIPGMTTPWRSLFRWSLLRAPIAPGGAHTIEWRATWIVSDRTMVPPRTYWDHMGFRGAPVDTEVEYVRWPWRREWADKEFAFGDPRLWRTMLWAEMDTYLNISIITNGLRARFYY